MGMLLLLGWMVEEAKAEGRDDPSDSTVLLGLGLSAGAGLATCLGALILFYKEREIQESKKLLAGSLALSAGVMIYVSFVEMFAEAINSFHESGQSESDSSAFAFLCLFGGIGICKALDMVVHYLHSRNTKQKSDMDASPGNPSFSSPKSLKGDDLELAEKVEDEDEESKPSIEGEDKRKQGGKGDDDQEKQLKYMGLLTGLAVALHNFPEGLATFVGTLDDSSVGATLAIAIAIHNIPEGIAVAMPIYFGGGGKWKAFGWAFLSGIAEPIGALIGYVILMDHFTDLTFGIVFGIVAGMMIYISFACLLPTAFRYDPDNEVTAPLAVVGMFVMGLSIVLFDI
eukprot:g3281.t1